jgi:hypothetical protein
MDVGQPFPLVSEIYVFLNGNHLDKSRMASSGMLRRVAHVRTDVSEELSASIIRAMGDWHPDDGGAKFLRNVGSYKSHTS